MQSIDSIQIAKSYEFYSEYSEKIEINYSDLISHEMQYIYRYYLHHIINLLSQMLFFYSKRFLSLQFANDKIDDFVFFFAFCMYATGFAMYLFKETSIHDAECF